MMDNFLEVKNLSVRYKDSLVFSKISFSLPKSGIFSILGRNGVGKTTLMYSLAGIIPSFIEANLEGKILINKIPPPKFKEKFFVFQDVEDSFIYHSVSKEIDEFDKGEDSLKKVGLEHAIGKDINELSFGEKHRLAIAIALASNSKILFLDESFSSLDYQSLKEIIPLLKSFSRKSLIIMATHSSQLAYELSDDILILHNNTIIRGKQNLKNAEKFGLRKICPSNLYL